MQVSNNRLDNLKNILIGVCIITVIGYIFYYQFIRTTNEIGFLGAGKVGRQVLIQSLDKELYPNVKVDSEFGRTSIFSRILFQEPLRTTFIIDIQDTNEFEATEDGAHSFLEQPIDEFISQFQKITMQENYEITNSELKKICDEKNVKNMADLLSGFGFKNFELQKRGEIISVISLNPKNIGHVGGE